MKIKFQGYFLNKKCIFKLCSLKRKGENNVQAKNDYLKSSKLPMDCLILFPVKHELSPLIVHKNLFGNVVRSSVATISNSVAAINGTMVHIFAKAVKFTGTHLCTP